MSLGNFKNRFVQRAYEKELKLSPNSRTPNANKIFTVGVLTSDEYSSYFNIVENIQEVLGAVRNVHMYSYRKFDNSDEKSYKHFTAKDFNWRARVIDASLETFLETPFDLLIGYFDDTQLYLELATLRSKAMFKVGFSGVNDRLFDLVIAEKPENILSFNNEIHKYLGLLQKI